MNINKKEIERQFNRVKTAGWLPWFQEAARNADTSTAHLLAIGSRETNLKNIRGDFRNGRWNGFGVMQVDVGTDPDYARKWTPEAVEPSIRRGGEIYQSKVDQIFDGQGKRLEVRKRRFTGKNVEPDDVRRIATAAYNSGLWGYYHFSRGENVDSTTTGHDYSRDVYDRAIEFAELLEKAGFESGALRREVELQGKYATAAAQRRAGINETPDLHLEQADAMDDQSKLIAANYRNDEPDDVEAKNVEDKGITTSTKAEDETAGSPPPAPAAEIKASQVSLFTKLGSLSIPAGVMTVLAAIGNFIQSLPPWAWVAMISVALLIAYLIWRDSQKRAHERTLKVMDAAADKQKNNLRLI